MNPSKKICMAIFSVLLGAALALTPIPPIKSRGADPVPPIPVTPPYIKLPATKTVKPNRYFCLKPDTNCKSVKWIIPDGLDPLDPAIAKADPNSTVLVGDTGVYTVQAYGALGDQASDIASCVVTIGAPPPVPPPGPNPPPTPTDLIKALQTGYNLDTDTDRSNSLGTLKNLYQGMVILSQTQPAGTASDWQKWMKGIIEAPITTLGTVKLVNLRKAIGVELASQFGKDPTATLSPDVVSKELQKVSEALKGVQ